MNITSENLNRYMWFGVAAMIALYIIVVLEDIVEALRKRDVVVLKVYEGAIEGEFTKRLSDKPIDWDKVTIKENENG